MTSTIEWTLNTLFCAFNLCGHTMNVPVRADAIAAGPRIRVVRLPAWSAAVYVRDFDDEGAGRAP